MVIDRVWSKKERISIDIPLVARRVYMPLVDECKNKVALMYGPLLYAVEDVDNGKNLERTLFAERCRDHREI